MGADQNKLPTFSEVPYVPPRLGFEKRDRELENVRVVYSDERQTWVRWGQLSVIERCEYERQYPYNGHTAEECTCS